MDLESEDEMSDGGDGSGVSDIDADKPDDDQMSDDDKEKSKDSELEKDLQKSPEKIQVSEVSEPKENVPTLETPQEMSRRLDLENQKISTRSNLDYQKCTVCGEHILISELEEHMRYASTSAVV